jgi:phospholipid N-methyltransferase
MQEAVVRTTPLFHLANLAFICERPWKCNNRVHSFFMTGSAKAASLSPAKHKGPWAMFFKGFLKHPVMVGSIIPSSNTLIRHMLGPVDWGTTKLFVEYGPGVGTFSEQILSRLAPDATYIAIDLNSDFTDYLSATITDNRFRAIHGSAADVEQIVRDSGFQSADYVLSGLPFSTLPDGVGPAIAAATERVLRPGGAFLVYQFRARVKDFLLPHFDRIDSGFEGWNIPPCCLFWAWKNTSDAAN